MKYKDFEQEYISGGVRLYQADCMKMLSQIPDKYYSLCICDPPYGIGEDGASNHSRGCLAKTTKFIPKKWDREKITLTYVSELRRVSRHQIIWGANHFISKLPLDSPCWIVWDKDNGSTDFADCELAWASFRTAVRKFKHKWQGMLQEDMKNKEARIHPTQKPVKLYEWLLKNYAKPGDRILDTHLGSGSIAIACHNMGYSLDGFEIDKDYYEAAVKRLDNHKRQGVLFTPQEVFEGKI